eukprot:CAMPEP_0116828868 /NCGR_PEP_ID=MMETSP0418-20121206/3882_1 /TAXON_ID=1158023 /ORGANISM="Astrosyne radiata, Strain 13vi08-1A" /LENGTH=317 /DNA_ID=CAMNT_0004457779 /DNA_START=148 /DNA_END=1098 /DNA_ORIENTATION=+
MGVWMLRQLPEYRNAKVVRSRDKQVLEKLDIVLDVGGTYNHEVLRYDHHQRGYQEYFSDSHKITPLSASGLIYRHYGRELLKQFYPALTEKDLDWVYVKLYESLLQALDAIDCGVNVTPEGVQALYSDTTGLSRRVARLNPRWNEIVDGTGQEPNPDERFEQAIDLCGQDFVDVMISIVESELPARALVEGALVKRTDVDASGKICTFPEGGMPWKTHLFDLERHYDLVGEIAYVLYEAQDTWRIQCVPVEGEGFTNRLSLPAAWRGLRDDSLSKVAGIDACRFCHANGFIGGNDTYEGVLTMARASIAQQQNDGAK